MNRKISALFAFSWPVAVFLVAIFVACWLSGAACGSEPINPRAAAALAATFATPPVKKGCECGCEQTGKCICATCDAGNKGAFPSCVCGCVETGQCTCHDCNHPKAADPFAHGNHAVANPPGCECPEGGCNCWTGEDCGANCAFGKKPKLGDRKVTDDPARPFTYGYGDAYGYGHELGWYRHAAPVYHQPAPQAFQAAPRFFGGGFGGNCGSSG